MQNWIEGLALPAIFTVGVMIVLSFYAGDAVRRVRLPALIGFMAAGVVLGPSLLNVLTEGLQQRLEFVTSISLGAVALGIGLEMDLGSIRQVGRGILAVALMQLAFAFLAVVAGVYLLSFDVALALLLGSIAMATAPESTAAVIQESRARGPMSRSLYAIVGIDNGLAIAVFGFAMATARVLLVRGNSGDGTSFLLPSVVLPLLEVALSLVIGAGFGVLLCLLLRSRRDRQGVLVQIIAVLLVSIGACRILGISYIFCLMIVGMIVVNTQPAAVLERLRRELTGLMPLLYVFFFTLAGAGLYLDALPHIGLLGVVYVVCRGVGKFAGAWLGAGRDVEGAVLPRYTGMALLSQAGVAIGLALIVRTEFSGYGSDGVELGVAVLTTVMAACVFFELTGPVLAGIALRRAGEIPAGEK